MRISLFLSFALLSVCFPVIVEAQIGSETNFNQKALVGPVGSSNSMICADGHMLIQRELISVSVGDPLRGTEDLPATPQTLADSRTPVVVTTRDVDGVHYEYTAFESLLPHVGRTFGLGLKVTNTTAAPAKAKFAIDLPSQPTKPRDGSKVIYGADATGHRVTVEKPWALMTLNSRPGEEAAATVPDALRKPRTSTTGQIQYAIRVKPGHQYSVAVGFYIRDNLWYEPKTGKRLFDIELNKKTVASDIDVIANGDTSHGHGAHCLIVAADAPAASDDNLLHLTVAASEKSESKDTTVAAIWVFEDIPADKIDCAALMNGKEPGKPLTLIRCGSERNRALTGEQMVYEWTLAPGESRQGEFLRPYAPAAPATLASDVRPADELVKESEKSWEEWQSKGLSLHLPDRDAEDLYYASLANMLMLRDQFGDYFIVTSGPESYHGFWYRDAAYINHAFDVSGHSKEAEESLRVFWNRPLPPAVNNRGSLKSTVEQDEDGAWDCPSTEYDSQGQAPWGLFTHYQMTGDRAWLEKVYPAILKAAKWTRDARAKTKINGDDGKPVPYYGLFPKGFGEAISENLNGERLSKTHVIYHDFWGVYGMRLSAEMAEILGHTDDAKWMRAEYDDFRKCVYDYCKANYFDLPNGGGRWKAAPDLVTSYDWWQVAAIFPGEVIPPHDPMLNGIYKHFVDTKIKGVWDTWPYITIDWACGHLLRDEPDDAEAIYYAYIRKATIERNWAEDVKPDTHIGMGDQPEGWGAAAYVLLLRNMLLAEREGKLNVCQALPREWLGDGKETEIKNAPTGFGEIDFHIVSHLATGKIEYSLHRTHPRGECTVRLGLRLPDGATVKKVLVDGAEKSSNNGFVEFPLGEKEVNIVVQVDRPTNQ